jgi:hypothetical protein
MRIIILFDLFSSSIFKIIFAALKYVYELAELIKGYFVSMDIIMRIICLFKDFSNLLIIYFLLKFEKVFEFILGDSSTFILFNRSFKFLI